jgi:hypothetical protein
MAERNARFTLCALEVVGDGVGDRKFDEGWRAGARWDGWFGLIIILLIPGEGDFLFVFFLFFVFCGMFSVSFSEFLISL